LAIILKQGIYDKILFFAKWVNLAPKKIIGGNP
jgi:hypothetical protein